jgi:glyoxylase-like metal-dependent hydrolase (beta-lactamase superfamily II)
VQKTFAKIMAMDHIATDASQFEMLFKHNQETKIGSLTLKSFSTPGHTPACMSYLIGNLLFTGDALFMPDYGTGRCDFPGGSAETLYHSVHEVIYSMPDDTMTLTGHDYMPNGRALRWEAPLAEQKSSNIHIKSSTTKEEYVAFRTGRDKTLSAPKLLYPSIQFNISAGHIPDADSQGRRFFKIPLSLKFKTMQ